MSDQKKLSARQYLEQLQLLNDEINQDLEDLENMKLAASSTGAIDYSKDRVQTSPQNALERRICNYTDFERIVDNKVDRYVDIKEQIKGEIRGLRKRNYVNVLYKVYVQFKSVKAAADEMKMNYNYVVELHNKALAAFEETYQNLYKLM